MLGWMPQVLRAKLEILGFSLEASATSCGSVAPA